MRANGHENIRYGAGPGESGPFYAYRNSLLRESLADWHKRVIADLDWGERRLRRHVPGYEPLAFAPPFGAYGQIGTNDPKIPRRLSRELRERFGLIFVQQDPHLTQPSDLDVSRLQLDRTITGGALHAWSRPSDADLDLGPAAGVGFSGQARHRRGPWRRTR